MYRHPQDVPRPMPIAVDMSEHDGRCALEPDLVSSLHDLQPFGGGHLVGAQNGAYLIVKNFRDGFFPFEGAQIKNYFEELKAVSPDLIFTHNRKDAHQDHRLITELTWNTFRNHLVLEYEIPKYDGDMGQPNLFVPLDQVIYEKKVHYIVEAFETQR